MGGVQVLEILFYVKVRLNKYETWFQTSGKSRKNSEGYNRNIWCIILNVFFFFFLEFKKFWFYIKWLVIDLEFLKFYLTLAVSVIYYILNFLYPWWHVFCNSYVTVAFLQFPDWCSAWVPIACWLLQGGKINWFWFLGLFSPTHPPQYMQSLFKRDKGITPLHSSCIFFKCNFYTCFLNIMVLELFLPMSSSYFIQQNKAWINYARNCISLHSKQREKYL